MALQLAPISFEDAADFVRLHHRHHTPPVGHKFSVAALDGDDLVGVVIVGRPVARRRDDGMTLEVTRLCTTGARNACSFLYGAAARAAFAMGYARIGTYILKREEGTSLAAAGWQLIAETPGRSWSVATRPRDDKHPLEPKLLFEKEGGVTKEIDITSEQFRVYTYGDGTTFRINKPATVHVLTDDTGTTHRVVDTDGVTHRPERGWVGITWAAKDGAPRFVA